MNQYDKMTKTPVARLIISLSIPTIISMLITNIYNLVDTMFVGKLGTSESGAVGIVFGFMAILQAIGFLFGQGSGSILSRQLGERNKDEASRTASTGFFSAFILAVIVAIICVFNLDSLVKALGSTDTIAKYAKTYIIYILLSAPFLVTSFTLNNILRYEGKAKLGMVGMMTGAIINMIGDPIFMFALNMKIAGAGLSTAISQIISFSILLFMFLTGKTETKISFSLFIEGIKDIGEIAATGLPSLLRQALTSVGTIILNLLAGPYGDAAIAAMSIVSRIGFFVFSIALGIGQGFQPISGFNYGAKKYKRLREAYRTALIMSEAVMILMTVLVLFNVNRLIGIFRDDIDVIRIGTRALIIQVIAQIFMPFCMMMEMLLQTTGNKLRASILSSLRSGLFFIPALFILSSLRGLYGIEEAQPLAMVLSCIPALYFQIDFFNKLPDDY